MCRVATFRPTSVLPAPGTPVTKQMAFSERDRADKLMVDADKLMAELLKVTAETLRAELDAMTAKEATARLEGELAALKARPWWRRLAV